MTWTQSGNIKGASGTPGASGATGPAGPTGATGASGGTGGTGGPGSTNWADIVDKPGAILNYKGTWNASTNSPTLSDATGSGGDVYRVSIGGSRNLGSGTISWEVGDYAIWSPVTSSWEKADTTDAVSSVAGRTGAVTLTSADLGASGTASSSTFLRGDNTWASPTGITRSILTITTPTTLASAENTDYVYFLSSSTTPSSDADFSSVTALLHCDGTNNSTTIVDSSSLASNWTVSGTAKLATGTKKFGTASVILAANDRIISSAATSNFGFASGAFTIEFQVNLNNVTSAQNIYYGGSGGSTDPVIYVSAGKIIYYVGADRITSTSSVSTGTWYHIAVSRSGTTTRMFINGTQEGSSWTDNTNYPNGSASFGSAVNGMAGYVDEVRITKGVARYTTGFTAPSAAFPDGPVTTLATPTLPTAVGSSSLYTLRNISGSSLTIGVTSSQQIDGATGGLSLSNNTTARLISDGSGWRSV